MATKRKIKLPLACPHLTISFLLLITSVVTIVGTYTMKYEFSNIFENYFEDDLRIPLVIIVAGSVMIIADASIGIVSLACKWYRGLITFLVCTACLLVAMIALVILAYVNFNSKGREIYSRLEEDLKNMYSNMDFINSMQSGLKCCGWNNFSDWSEGNITIIPQSCCIESRPCDTKNPLDIYSIGCYQAMSLFLYYRMWIVIVVLAVLALVEIVAITLSVAVCKHFPREEISESFVTDNRPEVDTALPRVHNPLANNSSSSVENNRMYVRRPTQLPAVLNYRSPHENFLRQPAQLRFDRRVSLPPLKLNNPYGEHTKWNN